MAKQVQIDLQVEEAKKHSVKMKANDPRGNWGVYIPLWMWTEMGLTGKETLQVIIGPKE